jgi:hypothetical protein
MGRRGDSWRGLRSERWRLHEMDRSNLQDHKERLCISASGLDPLARG